MIRDKNIEKKLIEWNITPSIKNMIGNKYGRLTVLNMAGRTEKWKYFIRCKCDCGEICFIEATSVKKLHTTSCGCLHREISSKVNFKHGESASFIGKNKTYTGWQSIKQRCFYTTHSSYCRYGAIGTTMCNGYKESYLLFRNDIGLPQTEEHTVDRIDPYGHYSCGKCKQCKDNKWVMNIRWADEETQRYNKKTTLHFNYNGNDITMLDAIKISKIPEKTLRMRISRGWSIDDAINKPLYKKMY